jgi:hypothetical protein
MVTIALIGSGTHGNYKIRIKLGVVDSGTTTNQKKKA